MENNQSVSPIQLNIDYPEKLSRLTTLFRFILIIPIFMVFFFGIATKEIVESCLPGGALNPIKKAINPLFATAY